MLVGEIIKAFQKYANRLSPHLKLLRRVLHTEKPITALGGLRLGGVRPDAFRLHSSVMFCPWNHPRSCAQKGLGRGP